MGSDAKIDQSILAQITQLRDVQNMIYSRQNIVNVQNCL